MELLKNLFKSSFWLLCFGAHVMVASQSLASSSVAIPRQGENPCEPTYLCDIVYPTYEESMLLVHGYCYATKKESLPHALIRLIFNHYYVALHSQITLALKYQKVWGGAIQDITRQWENPSHFLTINGEQSKQLLLWNAHKRTYQKPMVVFNAFATGVLYFSELCILQAQNFNMISFDIKNEAISRTYKGHKAPINCSLAGPAENQFLTGGSDKKVYLWSLDQSQPVSAFTKHQAVITALTLLREEKPLSGDYSGVLAGWDMVKEQAFYTSSKVWDPLQFLVSSVVGSLFALSGSITSSVVRLFDLRREDAVQKKNLKKKDSDLRGLHLLHNDIEFLTCGPGNSVQLWDLRKFEEPTAIFSYPSEKRLTSLTAIGSTKVIITDSDGGMSQLSIQ